MNVDSFFKKKKIRKIDKMGERTKKNIPKREKIGQPVWQHTFHMTLIWGIDKANFEFSRGALHVCDGVDLICSENLSCFKRKQHTVPTENKFMLNN